MPNERSTEDIVRDYFKSNFCAGQIWEEQTSDDALIKKSLSQASKSGSGSGKPEFLVRLEDDPDFIIVVECKSDKSRHESADRDRPIDYAVDGVLVYMAHLARHFDVIGIAVSGTDPASISVSVFRQLRRSPNNELLRDEHGPIGKLLPIPELRRLLTFDPDVRRRSQDELMAFSQRLHIYLRDYAKLSENEKPLAVSGCLLALRDDAFKSNWRKYKSNSLGREMISALRREIEAAVPEVNKQRVMLGPYQFLESHPELNRIPKGKTEWPLRSLVGLIEDNVRPFLDTYKDVDVIGQFYGEFLRYTGGDKQGLGIVLTPRHITDLFVRMVRVGLNDTVLDTCCGTGGFLIAAMAALDLKAGSNEAAREDIRRHSLVGIEQQPQMFALAASNMILRGDGKANLFQGSCFDSDIVDKIENPDLSRFSRPNIGLINPPFSQQGEGLHELDFVLNLLDMLRPGGRAAVILPMSCAIEAHSSRQALLEKHTLVASVSLPTDVFHPVGVVTCALFFEAHQPHSDSTSKTWFGAWKNDGFVKVKKRGRLDTKGTWPSIRDRWLTAFHDRREMPGESVLRTVTAKDEWLAEAYLETDYNSLTEADFAKVVREFAIFDAVISSEAGLAEDAAEEA